MVHSFWICLLYKSVYVCVCIYTHIMYVFSVFIYSWCDIKSWIKYFIDNNNFHCVKKRFEKRKKNEMPITNICYPSISFGTWLYRCHNYNCPCLIISLPKETWIFLMRQSLNKTSVHENISAFFWFGSTNKPLYLTFPF